MLGRGPGRRPQRRVRRRALRRGGGPAGAGGAARRRARAARALLGRRVRAAPGAAAAHPRLGGRPLAEPAAAGARGALGRPLPDRPARARGAGRGGRRDRVAARRRRFRRRSTSWSTTPPGTDPEPWIAAGATWCLTGFGLQPTRAEVERAIDAQPADRLAADGLPGPPRRPAPVPLTRRHGARARRRRGRARGRELQPHLEQRDLRRDGRRHVLLAFFPAEEGWGRMPVWGFAHVAASAHDDLPEGARVYGYFPPSSHLLVVPQPRGRRAASSTPARTGRSCRPSTTPTSARADEPSPDEDSQALFRPLFGTSFLIDDFLDEQRLLRRAARWCSAAHPARPRWASRSCSAAARACRRSG